MSEVFDAVEIIGAKRDNNELTDPQIDWVINAYTKGVVADEQMSALLMAILLNGMNSREISRWTDAMINSGERMEWSMLDRKTVDKHSTGGVGDKITLPLAPLVAACGGAVPQLSGRGLGHTGGTLDKLESIPGWRASLSNAEMLEVIKSCGAVICAAGAGLAPADKKLYALRDVTGTVQALVTAMDVPLGLTAGNALEVRESVEVLAGGGPSDVVELTLVLAREMLDAAGIKELMDPADALRNGAAMDSWKKMIRAQGGDPDAKLPIAKESAKILADKDGTLSSMDAMSVGIAAWRLGAGRSKQGEQVSFGAGIEIHAKPGAQVKKGDLIYTLHADESARFERAQRALQNSFVISQDGSVAPRLPLIIEKIEG
jgi:thymidine phosphorylase